ncbi:MAG: filamentous hemagglutinin N-terminal domain-containing protein [Cyanobacteria bacterium SBLK]|nr:filamentous hemagglutinin N-terminal domain-containing protein [Cyanobacteria bacterium SBLK]
MVRDGLGYCGLAVGCAIASAHPALAQIVPDGTLGGEGSVVMPAGVQREQIEGGALRGSNLFHSFQEFNVRNGHSAYFLNPAVVENIFSRVTGGNISEIFGTLGVLGEANLYLINPNGIIFGENASLDIKGSFVASTASSFVFPDGSEFNALNPEMPPLIVDRVPIQISLQFEGEPATIVNLGHLSTGGNLTLSGGNLQLEGELVAGEDLTLKGETVRIRDGENSRFVAAAGNDLLIQGNEKVDIFALNHGESGLFSGGDMVLRSNNAVIGDAHYYSGGSFRIEELDGDLGELESPNDPIIRSQGDVSFDSYIGASLHILAGGKVEIPGFIWITGTDPVNGLTETVTLFDGKTIEIDGKNEPTVDIRAGVDSNFIGSPLLTGTGIFLSPIDTSSSPSSANIDLGAILFADPTFTNFFAGQVLLTNQYQPNDELDGNIRVRGSSILGFGISANGGDISLVSRDNIFVSPNASILSSGLLGGNIVLGSREHIAIDNAFVANNNLSNDPNLTGGNLGIYANSLTAKNGAVISTTAEKLANAGDIILDIQNALEIHGENNSGRSTVINSSVLNDNATGRGGDIKINAGSLSVTRGGILGVFAREEGDGGNLIINVRENISIDGESNGGQASFVGGEIGINANGNGGLLDIKAKSLFVTNGSMIFNQNSGFGNSGNLILTVQDIVSIDGEGREGRPSAISSIAASSGNVGNIEIITGNLSITNGGFIAATTDSQGESGKIKINARFILLDGEGSLSPSSIQSGIGINAISKSNGIEIDSESLSLENGGQIITTTLGRGNGGNIDIKVSQTLKLSDGGAISTFAWLNSIGNAGIIDIQANHLSLSEESMILTGNLGRGDGGEISLQITDSVNLDRSALLSDIGFGGVGNGGDIDIQTRTLNLINGAQISASLASGERVEIPSGQGKGGSIVINATDSVNISGFRSTPFIDPLSSLQRSFLSSTAPDLQILNPSQSSIVTEGSSGLFVNADRGTIGEAGTITVNTKNFNISDSGVVEALTANSSQAGDVTINAETFEAMRGGQIIVTTFGDGKAGNINLNITDRTILSGSDPTFEERFVRDRFNIVTNQGGSSGLFANSTANSRGDGGKINVTSRTLELRENAAIAVDSQGTGIGGNIEIQSDRIDLDNSQITAETRSTQGGNIDLTVRDLLLMRHGSKISTTAGTAQTGGDGGNITINADNGFLVGPPHEDNDITANAFEGNGGRIDITAQAIFGLKFRDELTSRSDITASSEFGLDGTVQLNTLGIDPSNGLTNLPEDQTEPQVREGCSTGGPNSSSFTVQGISGSPNNPEDMLIADIDDEFIPLDELETDGTIEENQEEMAAKNQNPPIFSCSHGM